MEIFGEILCPWWLGVKGAAFKKYSDFEISEKM